MDRHHQRGAVTQNMDVALDIDDEAFLQEGLSETEDGNDDEDDDANDETQVWHPANLAEAPTFLLNDETAIAIGTDLAGYNRLTRMKICPFSALTTKGVKAFITGLHQSNVQCVEITSETFLPSTGAINLLYWEVMNTVKEVVISPAFFRDSDAAGIGTVLEWGTKLRWLRLVIGPFLTTKGARCLVNGIKSSNIEGLRIEANALPSDVTVMAMLYAGSKTIPRVEFNHPVTNDLAIVIGPYVALQQTLRCCCFKVELNIKSQGSRVMADAIRRSHMKSIELDFGDGTSIDSSQAMRTLLTHGVNESSTIRQLSITNAEVWLDAFDEILPRLRCFTSSRSALYPLFTTAIRTAHRLVSLQFHSCRANNSDIATFSKALASALPFLVLLRELQVCNIAIGDEGAIELAANMRNRLPKQVLVLACCGIGIDGARHIIDAVVHHHTLVRLDLSRNNHIKIDGLQMIGSRLPNLKLKELNVSGVALDPPYEEQAKASQVFVTGMRSNLHLHHLDVGELKQSPEEKDEIKHILFLNRHGRNLLQVHNELAIGVWSYILSQCGRGTIYYFLREQPTLAFRGASSIANSTKCAKRSKGGAKRRRLTQASQ